MTALYIDESKSKGYTIVAAVLLPADAREASKALRGLCKRGQRRIHFVKESDPRRREILSTLTGIGITSMVYHARGMRSTAAREACLCRMIADAQGLSATQIVLERDDSIVQSDKRILFRELDARGLRDQVDYRHAAAIEEPLLSIPDAIAWCHARGGEWTRRVRPLIREIIRVR